MIAVPVFVPEDFVDPELIGVGSRVGRIFRFGADCRACLLHQQLILPLMLELDQEKVPFRLLRLLHLAIHGVDHLHASHHQQEHQRIDCQRKSRFQQGESGLRVFMDLPPGFRPHAPSPFLSHHCRSLPVVQHPGPKRS